MESDKSPFGGIHQLFTDTTLFVKLLAVCILMGISYLITAFLGLLLAMPLFSFNWDRLQNLIEGGMSDMGLPLLYYLQGLQTFGLFILPAVLANRLIFNKEENIFIPRHTGITIAISGFLILLTLMFSAPLLQWIIQWNAEIRLPEYMEGIESTLQTLEQERLEVTGRLMENKSVFIFFINILIISVLPALGEEFFFRGILQKIIVGWVRNIHLGIFIAAVCFSAFHIQFYGFFPRLLLGLFFGYLYFWSNNIWIPVLAHFLNNTLAISLSFFAEDFNIRFNDYIGELNNNSVIAGIISLAITTGLIYLIRRKLNRPIKIN